MNKKYKILTFILGVLIICLVVGKLNFNKSEVYDTPVIVKENRNLLSIMFETAAGSGNYEMTSRSEWPTEGYVFNANLSKCENEGELSWDDKNNTVVMSGNVSDKCYVYFDVYVKPQVLLADYVKSLYVSNNGENGIYYHDASLTNGAGDSSYRFAGASGAVNNYVCFGSNTTPCPADNLYRIIGVFGDRVKLIKSDYATTALLGTDGDYEQAYTAGSDDNSNYKGNNLANIAGYTWNYKNNTTINSGYGSNTWSTSLLNKTNLNKNFITNIGADWATKIAETTWKVGGNSYANIRDAVPSVAYQNEIVSPVTTNATDNATTYSAKVGLMYASDYGFAATPIAWTTILDNYDYNGEAIINVNWMYMGLHEWTISRDADSSDRAFQLIGNGSLNFGQTNSPLGVRPVFYLSSSVNYVSGSGTAADPILVN